MMRSLYSGISGLRNHQTRMDVIGNNIANVNTAGYKTARVIFQDIFSQNVKSGMENQGNIGGTNPMQIGLGIRLSNVDVIHSRAAFGRTDRETDMMINGDGFFIVMMENPDTGQDEFMYTRAGNFLIDSEGYLVTSQGYFVMGYTVPLDMGASTLGSWADGITDPTDPDYKAPTLGLVPRGTPSAPDYNAQAGLERIRVKSDVYRAINWSDLNVDQLNVLNPLIVATATPPVIPDPPDPIPNMSVADAQTRLEEAKLAYKNVPTQANLTRLERAQTAYIQAQDRVDNVLAGLNPDGTVWGASPFLNAAGEPIYPEETIGLLGFSVADNGDVSVIINNKGVIIGRVAVAMFANPEGLEKAGNSLYRETASSGPVVVTEAYGNGAGKIDAGGLEMSNVDLADQFTDMIVTQRGFQANSRIITVSDSLLEELVNLKR